jgi:hypothetical protein
MSINAINQVSPNDQQTDPPPAKTPAPTVTPFSQQLDALDAQTGAATAHGHHHHHGAPSQSATSSAATAASAAGVASPSTVASSLLGLLS